VNCKNTIIRKTDKGVYTQTIYFDGSFQTKILTEKELNEIRQQCFFQTEMNDLFRIFLNKD